ncbi:hypothetical protein CEXT_227101 [Caerostris extrusa]|uniref:Uncharacterized protein n=1 Tax=Caerostris extrusa TaxID=172846 RepID=A0AAV4NCE5_CAEEX|nr:hypothetical protein CEXT_227101 [Caerostris extrusa]
MTSSPFQAVAPSSFDAVVSNSVRQWQLVSSFVQTGTSSHIEEEVWSSFEALAPNSVQKMVPSFVDTGYQTIKAVVPSSIEARTPNSSEAISTLLPC